MTEWLATYLLHSTVVLCSVLLLLRWAPLRQAAVRDGLLRTALLVPLFTAALATLPPAPNASAFPATQSRATRSPLSAGEEGSLPASAMSASSPSQKNAFQLSLPPRTSSWVTVLMVGSLLFAGLRFGAAWWFLRSRLVGHVERDQLPPHLYSVLEDARQPRAVELCWARLSVPCALGRQRILLPPTIQQTLTSDEFRAVLAHEYAHLLRRDPLWNMGLAFVTQVVWFQPLNWLVLAAWRRASEEQCDAWAGVRTSRLSLAQALLKLARVKGSQAHFTPVMTTPAVHTTHLTERINALIHPKEPTMKRHHLILLASSPLVLGALIPPLALATSPTTSHQIVVLDAAHGGNDPGAVGFAVEKEITLQIAKQIQQQLIEAGVQVIMTRQGDTRPSLDERIKLAISPAKVYVSIHTNASPDPQQHGVEAYISAQNQDQTRRKQSNAWAGRLVGAVASTTGAKNGGVKPLDSSILAKAAIPAVLLEVGFVTNQAEGLALTRVDYQQQISSAVARALLTSLQ